MIKIEINGQVVEAHEGDMLIDVADGASIPIPRFCYHKKLSIAANCRMCLVEVEGAPKALPACATPVTDGMKVFTKSTKAVAAQKSVMEFLLINHPLDCPICDQGGECELQDVAMEYGDDVSKYTEAKRVVGAKNIGSLISTDMTRCIHCTRCVRFGQEIGGIMELGATGRSEWMEIGTYIEKSVDSEMSGNMIDLCPVGALTSKPYRYSARPWELKSHKSIAPHDSIGSNVIIHTHGDRVMRVVPDENESINEVWISDRDRFSYEAVNSEDRLLRPMVKDNGEWKVTDWESALSFTVEGLKAQLADKDKIGVLASSSATLEELQLLQKLARGLGIYNLDHRTRQIDFSADQSSVIRPKLNHSFEAIENLDSILMIGSYLRKELPLLNHRVRKAQLNGASVSVVNPTEFDFNYDLETEIATPTYFSELKMVLKAANGIAGKKQQAWLNGAVPDDTHKAIAQSLFDADAASIFVGQIAQIDANYSQIVKVAEELASTTGATLSVLPMTANEVGAHLVNFLPENGLNVTQMIHGNMNAFINFSIEPENDIQDGSMALKAMKDAKFVVNFTAFDSDVQREYADVLLPMATFGELPGTFVNATGLKQSFKMAVEPAGEAKAAWKILRVLGNMFELEGFEQTHSSQVMAEVKNEMQELDMSSFEITDSQDSDLIQTKFISLYEIDALVRRAPSLQKTPDAQLRG